MAPPTVFLLHFLLCQYLPSKPANAAYQQSKWDTIGQLLHPPMQSTRNTKDIWNMTDWPIMEYKLLSTQTPCWNQHKMEVFCFSEEKAHEWLLAEFPLDFEFLLKISSTIINTQRMARCESSLQVMLPNVPKTYLKAQPITVSRTGLYQARS